MLDNKRNKLRGPGLEVSTGIAQDSMQEAALGSLQTTQTSETAVADVDGIW